MKAKTELLMYQLLWTADALFQPTFRNLSQSFEGWAYRRGLLPQIQRLEAEGLLESNHTSFDRKRVVRLTEAGRISAWGGRDPARALSEAWDGKWRLFLFDLPAKERALRRRVHRALGDWGCGCLQGSVWISPRIPEGAEQLFADQGKDCSHLVILAADSRGPATDRQMVHAAWDFRRINEAYRYHLEILERLPAPAKCSPQALLDWSRRENLAWLKAVRSDPLLPETLLPADYMGKKAWQNRCAVLPRAFGLADAHRGHH